MHHSQNLQKILALVILILIPTFILKEYRNLSSKKDQAIKLEGERVKNIYTTPEDKTFVVFIFSHENEAFCEKNLQSIFDQSYSKFRIVYLDHGEGEGNYKKAQELSYRVGRQDKITFIRKTTQQEVFDAFYQTIHRCQDGEIVMHLEGGDWLIDQDVLKKLNVAYKDPDVWLTYGESIEYPSLKKHELEPVINRALRDFKSDKTPWMISHLKTYYAGLLKEMAPNYDRVKEKASSEEDKMLMLSLLKMGKWHVKFIPEVLYATSK